MRNSYLIRVDADFSKEYSKEYRREIEVFSDQEKLIVQSLPKYSQKDRASEQVELYKLNEINPVDAHTRLIDNSKAIATCGRPGMRDEAEFAGVQICCRIPGRK